MVENKTQEREQVSIPRSSPEESPQRSSVLTGTAATQPYLWTNNHTLPCTVRPADDDQASLTKPQGGCTNT